MAISPENRPPQGFETKEQLLEAIDFSPQFEQRLAVVSKEIAPFAVRFDDDGKIIMDLDSLIIWRDDLSIFYPPKEIEKVINHFKSRCHERARKFVSALWDATREDISFQERRPGSAGNELSQYEVQANRNVTFTYRYLDRDITVQKAEINLQTWTYKITERGRAETEGSLLQVEDVLRFEGRTRHFLEDFRLHQKRLEAAARGMD